MREFLPPALIAALGLWLSGAEAAHSSHHLMQIEQVHVYGPHPAAQLIQLRMREDAQNFVAGSSLVVYDEFGLNPILLLTLPSLVANGDAGARILVGSSCYSGDPFVNLDFTMAALIPPHYLSAGRLTYESDGVVWWSFAWGGALYTGPNAGSTFDDDDGDFGPPWDGDLATMDLRAVRFPGPHGATSTSNAADYALTPSAAYYTNNAGVSILYLGCLVFRDGFQLGDTSQWSLVVP